MTYIYNIKNLYKQRESLYKSYKKDLITAQQYMAYVKPLDVAIDTHEMSIFLDSLVSKKIGKKLYRSNIL